MTENINGEEFLDRITSVVPSERQIELHRMGYYNFIHFGLNTFTRREWGNGKEDPSVFILKDIDTVSIKPQKVKTIVISEDITKSQRIEKFHITAGNRTVYSGTTVGYKKICRLKRGIRNCTELKIHIDECRKEPHIAGIGVY